MKHSILAMIFFTVFSAQAASVKEGCSYDAQCKGDRICDNGTCVAPNANEGQSDDKKESNKSNRFSTTCLFNSGPKAGKKQYWPKNTPGLTPARVGDPCHDGIASSGVAVEDE